MEEFLETIITILVGLGAFLISALRKRKGTKPKTQTSYQTEQDYDFEKEYNPKEESYSFENADEEEEEVYKPLSETWREELEENEDEYTGEEAPIEKETMFKEGESVLNKSHYAPEKTNKKRAVLQQNSKHKFDARKAIIYATIINRKYS
mgnify:CR=1 FL=1